MQDGPIAILAGGAGGLAVADHLERLLPHEDLVVLADQAYAPYAQRPPRVVVDRVTRLADDLVADGAKLAGAGVGGRDGRRARGGAGPRAGDPARASASTARSTAAAAAAGERGVAAIVGSGCVRGLPYVQAVRRARGGPVAALAWPGLVELVESGRAAGPAGAALARAGLEALRGQDVAVVALACAHAAAVAAHVQAAAGDLQVVDGAAVAADRTRATLVRAGLLARRRRPGRRTLMTSWPDRAGGLPAGARGGRRPG